jgi:phospholipase/carboxylesterase
VVGEAGDEGPIVVWLHGFGAPGTDLVPLADGVAAPGITQVFFEAPLELPELLGGRAWWIIDVARFQMAALSGGYESLEREDPEGLAAAEKALSAALDAALAELGADRPLILGGFSQGSMLALDHALRSARPLAAVLLLSPTLLARRRWVEHLSFRRGLRCFMSHGSDDPVLPFVQAQKLRGLLEDHGWDVTWHAFYGGHGIPPAIVAELRDFVRAGAGAP